MSDYISNNENDYIFYKSIYGSDNYLLDASYSGQLNSDKGFCDKDVGIITPVNTSGQYETPRCQQQRNDFGQDSALNEGISLQDNIDNTYVGELQRLSSKLIQLLKGANQRSIKVKASCGVSERPQLQQNGKDRGGSCSSHFRPACRQLTTQLKSRLEIGIPDTENENVFVEHVDIIPVGNKNIEAKALDGKTSCRVSQRLQTHQQGNGQGSSGSFQSCPEGIQHASALKSGFEIGIPVHDNIFDERVQNVLLRGKGARAATSNNGALQNEVSPKLAKASTTNAVSMNLRTIECSATPRTDTHKEKERLKKDIHNKIEKRRRCLINDKITELGNLLPEHINRASSLRKGSILKEAVEYIKTLRKDHGRVHRLEDKIGETCLEVKKLTQRLEKMETRMATIAVDNRQGDGQLQDENFADVDSNYSATAKQAKSREKATDQPSAFMITDSEMMDLDHVLADVSSAFAVNSTLSLTQVVGADINDMDCYF